MAFYRFEGRVIPMLRWVDTWNKILVTRNEHVIAMAHVNPYLLHEVYICQYYGSG